MPQVDPELEQQAEIHPEETFHVIVRVDGDLDVRQEQLEADGFTIKRRLRLIRGFAASATGQSVRQVMQETWIVAIEPDRQVHTMDNPSAQTSEENSPGPCRDDT